MTPIELNQYMVIGVFEYDHERFAETFTATTTGEAEGHAVHWADCPIIIAAVLRNGIVVA